MENILFHAAQTGALAIVMWVCVSLFFFLLVRELMLWYWKINQNSESLSRIADSLEVIANAVDFMATDIDAENGEKSKSSKSTVPKKNTGTLNSNDKAVGDE